MKNCQVFFFEKLITPLWFDERKKNQERTIPKQDQTKTKTRLDLIEMESWRVFWTYFQYCDLTRKKNQMTKTIEPVTGLISPKDLKRLQRLEKSELNGLKGLESRESSRESSASPPLVLKYLETLQPEQEVTLLLEVVEHPVCQPEVVETFKAPKVKSWGSKASPSANFCKLWRGCKAMQNIKCEMMLIIMSYIYLPTCWVDLSWNSRVILDFSCFETAKLWNIYLFIWPKRLLKSN